MTSVIAFEPRRFERAAPYYLAGRPAYAARLVRRISNLLGFDKTHKLLDLGTGPGLLAVAFAPYVADVTAIDPEPEMLRLASERAAKAGVRLTLLEGSSPGRIGARADELAVELRAVLAKYAVDGAIQEVVESEALLAFRTPR